MKLKKKIEYCKNKKELLKNFMKKSADGVLHKNKKITDCKLASTMILKYSKWIVRKNLSDGVQYFKQMELNQLLKRGKSEEALKKDNVTSEWIHQDKNEKNLWIQRLFQLVIEIENELLSSYGY